MKQLECTSFIHCMYTRKSFSFIFWNKREFYVREQEEEEKEEGKERRKNGKRIFSRTLVMALLP